MRAYHAVLLLSVLLVSVLLEGCVDTAGKLEVDPNAAVEAVKVVAMPGTNIAAAPLSIERLEGLSPEQTGAFVAELQKQAAGRQVAFAEVKKAKYLAQGYISAFTVGAATRFIYVWDVFDASQHLRQRVSDAVIVQGAAAEPMALLSVEVSNALAAKSAEDLAAVLSNMPEARGK